VRADDERHPEVQMIERISEDDPKIHAMVFRNNSTEQARRQILRWLDVDGDGRVSDRESRARASSCWATAGKGRPSFSLPPCLMRATSNPLDPRQACTLRKTASGSRHCIMGGL
jgi:hypothetical protein